MKPTIDSTEFGSITIEGQRFEHDVLIRPSGKIKKRKKKLSKKFYGTSHTISQEEAEYIYGKGARELIIGTGQEGNVHLSAEAEDFFREHECRVTLSPTPEAITAWNDASLRTAGLFHVTC
ncbi:MAG: hypothetical protein HYV26_03240 [Candidatus Hydrogenedentes bacterium]|nr:hypothetical protein [Candidatus Hydrogenedentota bacterium]